MYNQVMGRPRIEITTEMIAEAEKQAARGLTKVQIAYCLGFSYETLRQKEKEFSAFSAALQKGKCLGIRDVANALYESAIAGSIHAQKFFLKNADPANWKERPVPYEDEDSTPTRVEVVMVDGRRKDKDGNPIEHEFGHAPIDEEAA